MSSNTADPLELLQYVEKRLVPSRSIVIPPEIENEYSSLYVLADKDLSRIYRYLGTLQRIEEEYGSFRVFLDNSYLVETAERIHQEGISSSHANDYPFLEGPPDVANTMEQTIRKCRSFYEVLNECDFSEEYYRFGTRCQIREYRLKLDYLREEFNSFMQFLYGSKDDLLGFLLDIEEEERSFRKYSERIRSNISNFLETARSIGEEWGSLIVPIDLMDRLEFLKREFKLLGIILNFRNSKHEPHVVKGARDLFQVAANDLVRIQEYLRTFEFIQERQECRRSRTFEFIQERQECRRSRTFEFIPERQECRRSRKLLSNLQYKFWNTKSEIRRTRYSFREVSFQLLANKDGIVIPNLVMKFIDPVAENLSDLLKVKDPRSPLCVEEPLKGQIKKALEELNFLKSFVYFVSDRWIEPQSQLNSFNHILEVAWHKTMLAWLYLPSFKECGDSLGEEINSLFSEIQIQTERSVCKIYIGVLQAVKLVQLQWYPVFQIKHIVDCEVGFVDALLHNLEELTISSNFIARKKTLQEMLNILRANLINLPLKGFLFHLQHINSVIVDAGILVCSLTDVDETYQALALDFSGNIQSIQAVIYLITRKSFFLQSNLSRTDRLDTTDFSFDNLKGLLSFYSDSIVSVQSQIQTIQNELKCFQADVEKQDELQHFAADVIGLAYEVEHIYDTCKGKKIPDCCLFVWILHIEEDIRLLMAEVAEIQEENVLPNTKDDPPAHTSSQFAKNPHMNEGTVGLTDVMNELRDKLTEGSLNLDVISIFGMPGVGKTTLANKLYLDQSVVFHFDIRAQVCVSQEYTRKDMLLTILGDLIGKNAKLDEEAESALADKLKQNLLRRRYLIFIDDIWHTSAWNDLWSCFQHDDNGSRIILTTRHRDVASAAKIYSDPFELLPLSSEKSWTLLKNKVFNEERCPPDLQNVGEKIAQKCCGLPLSIILVAGILTRMEKEEQCWEQVMTNLAQHIGTLSDYTIDLSYQNLPDHLKPCFLYFGLFSEDKEIQVSKLTWLWISEGFVTTHTEKLLEVVAKDYLENLVGRNLVMVAKKSFDGTIKTCRVHDLLFEFCTKKAKLNNFSERIKWDKGVDVSHVFPSKYRTPRLSLHSQCDNLQKWCSSFSHVKSFQFREARKIAFSSIDHASYTFRRFKFLRVLDIELTIIDSFPQELTLLKYLAFRTAEDAISLPANLWNLETLIVQGIKGRVLLPDTFWKMVKLRHLHIYDQVIFTLDSGQELSESPSTMNALQTISSPCFSCVDNADKILAKTPNLQKLRCKVEEFDGSFPAFDNLTELEMLKISSGTRLTLINQLKFPSKLKKLTLSNFHIDLTKVATLLELEVLKLLGVTISSNIWKVNDEQFLQLKFLKLEDPSFSEWDASGGAFPSLEHLVLKRCRHLKVIPSCFEDSSSLKSVEIIACDEALAASAEAVKETLIDTSGSGFEIFVRK